MECLQSLEFDLFIGMIGRFVCKLSTTASSIRSDYREILSMVQLQGLLAWGIGCAYGLTMIQNMLEAILI